MRRWLVLFFAVLLPLQFGWSAASAYCRHEVSTPQGQHLGHHAHAHQGDAEGAAEKSANGKSAFAADADCASCHAAGTAVILAGLEAHRIEALASGALATTMPPFSSAPARAPDRPQWPRLV